MGKKNMDALLSNIMGEALIRPSGNPAPPQMEPVTPALPSKASDKDVPWKHFSFICSVELADKVQAIARKEGFSIRALMEYMMNQGVASYEAKHGKVRKVRSRAVTEVM